MDRFIFRVTIGAVGEVGGMGRTPATAVTVVGTEEEPGQGCPHTGPNRQLHVGGAGGGSRVWKPTPCRPSGRLPIRHLPPSPLQSYLPGGANPPPALHGLLMLRWFQKGK